MVPVRKSEKRKKTQRESAIKSMSLTEKNAIASCCLLLLGVSCLLLPNFIALTRWLSVMLMKRKKCDSSILEVLERN